MNRLRATIIGTVSAAAALMISVWFVEIHVPSPLSSIPMAGLQSRFRPSSRSPERRVLDFLGGHYWQRDTVC